MYPRRSLSKIYPKISTLPRQKSEAAQYLSMYKLTVEKQRIEQELSYLEQRRMRLQTRLAKINDRIGDMDINAHQIRNRSASAFSQPTSNVYPPSLRPEAASDADDEDFTLELLEY